MSTSLEQYSKFLTDSSEILGQRMDGFLNAARSIFSGSTGRLKVLRTVSDTVSIQPKDEKGHSVCQDSVQYITKLTDVPGLGKNAVIDFPLICTADPLTGRNFVTSCFTQILDDTTIELDIRRPSTLSKYIETCTHRLPIAICAGIEPALKFSAAIPQIGNVCPLALAGFLMERPVTLANCFTQDVKVPSDCHYVIEGYIQKSEEKHLFHATAFTHRKDADSGTFSDNSPYSCIFPPLEIFALRYMKRAVSQNIADIHFGEDGIAAIRLDGPSERTPESLALTLWGTALFEDFHTLLITDRECDLRADNEISRIMEQALSESMGFNGLKKLFHCIVE